MAFFPQDNQSVSRLELNVITDLKLELSIGVGTLGVLLNEELTWWNVGLNECGGDFLR